MCKYDRKGDRTGLELWENHFPLKNSEKIHSYLILEAEQLSNGRQSAISKECKAL